MTFYSPTQGRFCLGETVFRTVIIVLASALSLAAGCGPRGGEEDDGGVGFFDANVDGGAYDVDGHDDAGWIYLDAETAGDGSTEQDAHLPEPNEGWIGGRCSDGQDCDYQESICLSEGYPDGMCSLACDGLCPDSDSPMDSVTFCIEDPDTPQEGICVSRCDNDLYPVTGCRDGYICEVRVRFNNPGVSHSVCLPDDGSGPTCSESDVPQPNAGVVEPPGVGGCPGGMTPIPGLDVCIDIWEAHIVEVLQDNSETPWSPFFNPQNVVVKAKSAPGAVPQGYISGAQAAAACAEAGKRLCNGSEWEAACRGSANYIYPYGNTREPGVCNDARSIHPAVEYFGTSDSWIWSELDHPCLNQLDDSLDPTGDNSGCVSEGGVYDMMGNLHEWINDANGTFKGGFYVDTVINGEGCLYTTTAHNINYWDYSTGFRCCADKP